MYQVILLPHFLKKLKPHIKKRRSLKIGIIDTLEKFNADQHIHLGHHIYKVRLATANLNKGKNKSFRLIVLLIEVQSFLVPITIYSKSDQSTILLKELNDELEIILDQLNQ